MSDETNPTTVDETTQGGGEITTSQRESENPTSEESSPDRSEESQGQLTLEDLQKRNEEYERKIADLNKGFTTKAQEAAELRRLNEQYQGALGQFVSQQRLQNDPLAAAKQQYREARENFDTDAELAALDRINELNRIQAVQESVRLQQAASQVERVKSEYGIDEQELQRFYSQMTVEDLAFAKLRRDGRLDEFLDKTRKDKERRAQEAAAIGRLVGDGSPGTVPGGHDDRPQKRINDITFGLLPKERQKELIEDGFRVFNNRTGEDVT